MQSIQELIQCTINQSIPLPDIFQYFDYTTPNQIVILGPKETELRNYLMDKCKLSNMQSTQYDKLNQIQSLLRILWQHRDQLQDSLLNFKKNNKELIQLLCQHSQTKSLEYIDKFTSNLQGCQYEKYQQFKLKYLKSVLMLAVQKEIAIPHILYCIQYNFELHSYYLTFNKKLTAYLKQINIYKLAQNSGYINEHQLIYNSLNLIIKQQSEAAFEIINSPLLQELFEKTKTLKDPITQSLNTLFQMQDKVNAEISIIKTQIKQTLCKIYLEQGVNSKIAIPELLTILTIQNVAIMELNLIPTKQYFDSCIYNPLFEKLNSTLNVEIFFLQNNLKLSELSAYLETINKVVQSNENQNNQYILKMLKIILENRYDHLDQLLLIKEERRYQRIVGQYIKILNKTIKDADNDFIQIGQFLIQISQFIDSQIKTEKPDPMKFSEGLFKTINNSHSVLDLSIQQRKTFHKNMMNIMKYLIGSGRAVPEFLKYVSPQKQKTEKYGLRYIITNKFFVNLFEDKKLYYMIKQLLENHNQQQEQITEDLFKNIICSQILPDFSQQNGRVLSEQQSIIELLKLCYEQRNDIRKELENVLQSQNVKYLYTFLHQRFQQFNSLLTITPTILSYLQSLYRFCEIKVNLQHN